MWHGLLYNTSRVNCLWNLFYKKHAPWSQICFWKIQCWALLPEGWGIKTGTQSHWTVHNYILKLYVCFSKCPTDYLWCRESDWQDFRPLLHPKFNECAWKKEKNKTERGRINDWAVIKKKKKQSKYYSIQKTRTLTLWNPKVRQMTSSVILHHLFSEFRFPWVSFSWVSSPVCLFSNPL